MLQQHRAVLLRQRVHSRIAHVNEVTNDAEKKVSTMPRAGQLGVVVVGMPEEDTLNSPHRPVAQDDERTTAVRAPEIADGVATTATGHSLCTAA